LKKIEVIKAIVGKNNIRNRLNFNAVLRFVYFLPCKKTPNIKMATVDVDLPNICRGVNKRIGISNSAIDKKNPIKIEIIKGFLDSFFNTVINPFSTFGSSSLYTSNMVIESATLIGEIAADDRVPKNSPLEGKANITNGIPKKDKLPKIVLKIKR
jgi:hypothetical protein